MAQMINDVAEAAAGVQFIGNREAPASMMHHRVCTTELRAMGCNSRARLIPYTQL